MSEGQGKGERKYAPGELTDDYIARGRDSFIYMYINDDIRQVRLNF